MSSVHFTLATHSGIRHTVHVVKRSCTAGFRFRVAKEEVMHMSHTELPSILLAIASLLFTLYFGLRYKEKREVFFYLFPFPIFKNTCSHFISMV